MAVSHCVFCVLITLLIIIAECHHAKWIQNMKMVLNFPCVPRPRSIPVAEFFENEIERDNITPRYAILYRCDESTGCCKNMKKKCTVVSEETVEVAFFLQKGNKHKYQVLHMKNHTDCGCQYNRNTIK